MRLEEHFESSSTLQRNERVKLAASFWNNVGAGMVIGGMAGAFFLDKPPGAGPKSGSQWLDLRLAGFVFARREPGAIFWPPTPASTTAAGPPARALTELKANKQNNISAH